MLTMFSPLTRIRRNARFLNASEVYFRSDFCFEDDIEYPDVLYG